MHVFLTFLIVLRVLNVSAAVRMIQSNNVRHGIIHFRFYRLTFLHYSPDRPPPHVNLLRVVYLVGVFFVPSNVAY
jgi:hypothetical protein